MNNSLSVSVVASEVSHLAKKVNSRWNNILVIVPDSVEVSGATLKITLALLFRATLRYEKLSVIDSSFGSPSWKGLFQLSSEYYVEKKQQQQQQQQ